MKNIYITVLLLIGIMTMAATCKKSSNTASTTSTNSALTNTTTKTSSRKSSKSSKKEFVDTVLRWTDYESGYQMAVAKKKMLLVDVYTEWCGWCKVMDRETYTDDSVIYYINKYFVPVKLNPEVERSYTFHAMTKGSYEVHAWLGYGETFGYPTTYFVIDPGKSDQRNFEIGYIQTKEFIKRLKERIALQTKL